MTRKMVYVGIIFSLVFPIAFGIPMVFACKPVSGEYSDTSPCYAGIMAGVTMPYDWQNANVY